MELGYAPASNPPSRAKGTDAAVVCVSIILLFVVFLVFVIILMDQGLLPRWRGGCVRFVCCTRKSEMDGVCVLTSYPTHTERGAPAFRPPHIDIFRDKQIDTTVVLCF